MKLLYIIPYVPYPLNSGGNQAFFTITDHIRKYHDISILLYAHNSKDKNNIIELKSIWDNVDFYVYEDVSTTDDSSTDIEDSFTKMSWFDRNSCHFFLSTAQSMYRKIERRKAKIAVMHPQQEDLVRSRSTLFASCNDINNGFCKYVQQIAAKGFDAIQVEFYEYLPLIPILPAKTKKIFVHHELRFIRNENELNLFKNKLPTDYIQFQREKSFELSCLSACDAVITLTETDKKILCKYIPSDKIYASPAIININTSESLPFKPAKELVFIGSGDHFPNADAMIWFCQEVMPLLKAKMSNPPKLNIIGQWRDDLKTSIKNILPEVNFTGYIEDLPSFINGKISVIPVRIGSGMRIKILDSIFAGAPIVTTSKGCEGLPMAHRKNCLIADEKDRFAEAIIEMESNDNLQELLATNAQTATAGILNKEALFAKRLSVYESLSH